MRSVSQGAPRAARRTRLSCAAMNPGDPRSLFDRHAPRILARWREQLRAMPPSSALATPELLTPLMASALALVRQESVLSDAPDPPSLESGECRCGLNPLVTFYLTGECATIEVFWTQPDALAPLAPELRETLCRGVRAAWQRVASLEIALFCSVCQRGAGVAGPALSEPGRAVSGAVHSRAWATARRSAGTPG